MAFNRAANLKPDDFLIRYHQLIALARSGDGPGVRAVAAEILERFGKTDDPSLANSVAWACALVPEAVLDHEAPIRLATLALSRFPAADRPVALNTLGATLLRAGRPGEAIARLKEGIRARQGQELPQDLVFLALAELKQGNLRQAEELLAKLKDRKEALAGTDFWEEQELVVLSREALASSESPNPNAKP
jgi:hypothetical protein